ncbi:MAG: bifunctional diaminohydroxyphosphoribosylaminopyrimidine deaminase/5-amino-6-(5-phosphoribosylamino)uracil reductase RibD [Bacteroidaceae bacterium]|nr:bifunctional diaminohydroxyphosphoribosylaminopyrimidine deaminase/5-amino-6-(5-phosphoribosylamino)uracil reductase RibD [Bacteroidaceae bacterium]
MKLHFTPMTEDEKYMARCLQLARHGELTTAPNPMVGAVIVHHGRILGEGWHRRYGGPHAEVNAVRSVRAEDEALLREATIYVSLEPCSHWGKTPPCAALLVEKGFRRVVVGCMDPNEKVAGRGIQLLREAGAEVVVGVLEAQCRWLNRKFMTQHTLHRPYITLKWAQSADGYIDRRRESQADGPAVQFSTPWTQMLVHRLRATHEAILVGRRTWELDQPGLTTRYWPGKSPERLVLSRCTMHSDSECIVHGAGVHSDTFANGKPESQQSLCTMHSSTMHSSTMHSSTMHSKDTMHPSTMHYQSLLVEGGAQTLQSFIDADLWDEAYIERSPLLLGDGVRAPQIQTDPKGRPVHVNFT